MALSANGLRIQDARATDGTDGYKQWVHGSGEAVLEASGTPNGCSIGLYKQGADGNDVPVRDTAGNIVAVTATGTYPIRMVQGEYIKAVQSSSGGSTAMTVAIFI